MIRSPGDKWGAGDGGLGQWLPYEGAGDRALRAMVDVTPAAAAVWLREGGEIAHGNPVFCHTLGIIKDAAAGRGIGEFIADSAETADLLRDLDAGGAVDARELRAVRSDGEPMWVRSSHRAVTYGGEDAVFSVFFDDTGARLAQDAEIDETRRRTALTVISRILNGSRLGRSEYERLVAVIFGVTSFDRIAVTRVDAEGGNVESVFVQGASLPEMTEGTPQSIVGAPEAYVAATRNGLVLGEGSDDDPLLRFPMLEPAYNAGLRSFVFAPLIANDRVLGTVNLASSDPDAYRTSDLEFMERVGAHLAPAIDRARLHEALEQEVRERETLAAIGRVISSSPDISLVSGRFSQLVSSLIPAERIAISAVSDDGRSILDLFVHGIPVPERDAPAEPVPAARSMLELAISGRRTILVHATTREAVVRQSPHLLPAFTAGLRSFLSVPLIVDDDAVGVLHLRSTHHHAYRRRQVSLAESIAAQVAGVIALSRLRHAEKEAAEERRALSEIAVAANQDLDLRRMFERVSDALVTVIDYDRIEVALIDPRPGPLRMVYVRDAGADGMPAATILEHGPLTGTEDDDYAWQPRLEEVGRACDGQDPVTGGGALCVPLGTASRRVGHVRLVSKNGATYDETSLALLQRVAEYVTPAVQNALEHRQTLELARERRKIITLDAEKRELQRLSDAKSRFIATVSHELKTPLTSMLAFTDIMRRNRQGRLGSREIDHLGVIQRNGRRLSLLIDDLLDLGRIERGTFALVPTEFDAAELITDIGAAFKPIVATKRQTLTIKLPAVQLWLDADRDRLAQVLSNLISNAAKYSPENTDITVSARRRLDRLYVSVQDQGIGIPEADMQNMFTSFYRVDNEATRAESGTGLGLYIARNIVALHGGKISVTSREGDGTTVKLNIPGLMNGPSQEYIDRQEAALKLVPQSRLDDLPESLTA